VASGDAFWESPDIWFDGGDALGNAIAGKPTPVHARIWNLGTLKAFPTRVDFGSSTRRSAYPGINRSRSAVRLRGSVCRK
jgi:hypothetical protein